MDAEGELAPASSEDGLESVSNHRSSSLSLSQNSPSIPAEGDWMEAADLDGDRWVNAEDMDNTWGDAAQPPPSTMRVNDLDTYADNSHLDPDAPHSGVDAQQPAVDFNLQSRVNSATMQADDVVETSAPSAKRARRQSFPMRLKPSDFSLHQPSVASHHALIPADPSTDLPHATLSSPRPSKEETLFTEAIAGSNVDSEDDTGSSGDISADPRQIHTCRQALASSPHGVIAGSVSGEEEVGSQEAQASSHGSGSDEDSELSDDYDGVPSQYCINCMSRTYLGDMMCLVSLALSDLQHAV